MLLQGLGKCIYLQEWGLNLIGFKSLPKILAEHWMHKAEHKKPLKLFLAQHVQCIPQQNSISFTALKSSLTAKGAGANERYLLFPEDPLKKDLLQKCVRRQPWYPLIFVQGGQDSTSLRSSCSQDATSDGRWKSLVQCLFLYLKESNSSWHSMSGRVKRFSVQRRDQQLGIWIWENSSNYDADLEQTDNLEKTKECTPRPKLELHWSWWNFQVKSGNLDSLRPTLPAAAIICRMATQYEVRESQLLKLKCLKELKSDLAPIDDFGADLRKFVVALGGF